MCQPPESKPQKGSPHELKEQRNTSDHQNDESSFSSPKKRDERRSVQKRRFGFPKKSVFLALDCEMVGTGKGGEISCAARVTIIDWFGSVVLDTYIKQKEEVTDYRTEVSGITPEDLQNATLTFEECRSKVLYLLRNKILVGHALRNDCKALGITHPWWLTRDTAKYTPFLQEMGNEKWPRKLKDLAFEILSRQIQVSGRPHCPYEDAKAALDLYKSLRPKWERTMSYKIQKTKEIRQQQQQQKQIDLTQ
jgi:RNA exonuclease 4